MLNIFKRTKELNLIAPMSGTISPLADVPDKVFATGMMGTGLAFNSADDTVLAPCAGKITVLPITKHAFGIKTANDAEILVHIGLDTVNLQGEGFTALVQQGDKVQAGTPIIQLEREAITKKGYNLVTMLLITNSSDYDVQLTNNNSATGGETQVAVVKNKD